jgi:transglutaminase-like putative cysteine protease
MTWRLDVRHSTTFSYVDDVLSSYNEARISPLDTANQFTLEHRVDVTPAATLFRYRDYWGSRVHAFDLHHPHRELTVVGSSLVETAERMPTLDETVAWAAIDAPGLTDRLVEYLTPTAMTAADGAVQAFAAELRAELTPAGALATLGDRIRDRIEYQPGATSVSTTAPEVLEAGRGVCQDFVHVGLAILRAAGIPGRYSSGYLYPTKDADGEIGVTHAGESHAWLEAWAGDWYPIDPTSGSPVAERHVLVARGRDYSDVTPLKGIYQGGPSQTLDVTVEIRRVA